MFISFFSGKVMLFYGISLIMKEKSNASALGSIAGFPQKEHDRPASHHKDADGRQRERKQGAGLSYSNHNL